MDLFVIGDEDTVLGFHMAGVDGEVVENEEEAAEALESAQQRGDDILILPERVAGWLQDRIDEIRYGAERPLVVEVPGIEGPSEEMPSLFRLIREAVGIKFGE
jgi:V/A-type H+-transporting ATPase subunit F